MHLAPTVGFSLEVSTMPQIDFATLEGKKGLILGIANEHSIAYGCAKGFKALGAELAITYLNAKARPHVEPLARKLDAPIFMPCDVQREGELEAVVAEVETHWGKLDFALHSIAFAPRDDLQGRLVDASLAGFTIAMDASCHSFIRLARLAEPLMRDGGSLLTMSFHGAAQVVPHYNLMGPVKAALESSVRYLAAELGPQGIRVYALSPGPIETRAASGLKDFAELVAAARQKAPLRRLVGIDDVGRVAAILATPAGEFLTGQTIYVDAGLHCIA
jgi:enoyl-[acyl-carrier protein] reductase I